MKPEILQTIQKVSKALSKKYSFGYYDREDIEQEAFIIALEGIGKFDPEISSLENFLYIHIGNRLKNILRKQYYRKEFECKVCKGEELCDNCKRRRWRFDVKKHLMDPIDIENVNDNKESNMYTTPNFLENMELDEIFLIINRELEIHLRIDYLKMLEGLHVPKIRRILIENRLLEILEGHGYGE